MVLFRGTVYSRLVDDPLGHHWTNVYTVDAADTPAALASLADIAAIQADVMYSAAEVYKTTVKSFLAGSESFSASVSLPGAVVAASGVLIPQWNVARVDFLDALGKPEIKYLRLPLMEESITGQNLTNGVITSLSLSYGAPLVALGAYVGPSGETITDFSVHTPVQMRQTSWHRRFRPGFVRGWVPA